MSHWLFEITRACNRSCAYCYNFDRRAPDPAHLAPDHVSRLVDRLFSECEPEGITIIGGEPLLVGALESVVGQFARCGVPVTVSTHGLLLSRGRIASLIDAGVTGFEVSLDSVDGPTHEALTGGPGLDHVRRAVAEIVRGGARVMLGCMLTRPTAAGVGDVIDLGFALSAGRVVLTQMAPVGFARGRPDLALTRSGLRAVLAVADDRAAVLDLDVAIGLPVEPCRIDRGEYPNLRFEACRGGEDKWLIEPSGAVRVCELSPVAVGNLLESPMEALERSERVQRFRGEDLHEECAACKDWDVCRGGCRFLRKTATAS